MDFQLEQLINGPAGSVPLLDALMRAVAAGGEVFFIAVVLGWLAYGAFRRSVFDEAGATLALLAAGVALATNQVISMGWARPRPFISHPGAVHVLLAHPADASFPSDHAAAAFAIAVCLLALHRRSGLVAAGLAALLCFARVYVGDHYPGDVVGGTVIGGASGAVVVRVGQGRAREFWAGMPWHLPRA